ncbi:SCO family protein [bacterium]|nr:SCO family protein [bacterium]
MVLLLAISLVIPLAVSALEKPGENLKEVGLTTENGTQLDLTRRFTAENGREAPLSSFLHPTKPTILVPAYYDCPRLCGLLLSGVTELLKRVELHLGDDFSVVTLSFNPEDTAEKARETGEKYRSLLGVSEAAASSWLFLSGASKEITPLMQQLGFRYKEDRGEFAHTAAIFVLTPEGKISQHFAGISFPYRDVRLALVEASEGKIGTLLDHALLYCFRFDPSQGKYTWAAFNVMRAGGGLTFLLLAGFIFWLRKREKESLSDRD